MPGVSANMKEKSFQNHAAAHNVLPVIENGELPRCHRPLRFIKYTFECILIYHSYRTVRTGMAVADFGFCTYITCKCFCRHEI